MIVRPPVDPFARQYVYFFGVVPAFAGTLIAVLLGSPVPVGGVAPLFLLSGLLVVVAAGDGIRLSRQHVVIATWFGLLIIPPIMAALALFVLPWLNIDLRVAMPAQAIARFFAETFERRIGTPLQIVAGDPRTAALIALGAPSRPSLYLDATPERSPWVTRGGGQGQGRDRGLADHRYGGDAAGRDQGALPRPGARGSPRLRARGAGTAAAHPHRLGGDQAASGGQRTATENR